MNEVPESDELRAEKKKRAEDRLLHHIAGVDAMEEVIEIKGALSEAMRDGIPTSAILADYGGREEVERRIGTEAFNELFGGQD